MYISIHEAVQASTCRLFVMLLILPIFQSTKPYRLRPVQREGLSQLRNFNPRSRIGFDFSFFSFLGISQISIHEAVQASTETFCKYSHMQQFQSTKPYRLRLLRQRLYPAPAAISIHEAVQASTFRQRSSCRKVEFQSTKPYRLRPYVIPLQQILFIFQSTKPYRLRPVDYWCLENAGIISIHEAVQASTAFRLAWDKEQKFQSTKPYRLRHSHLFP